MKSFFTFIFILFPLIANAEVTEKVTPHKTIYAALPSASHIFWRIVQKGIEQAAKDSGYESLVRMAYDESMYKEKDVQLILINYMIEKGAKRVIIAPSPAIDKKVKIPKVEYVFAGRDTDEFTLPFEGKTLIAIDDYKAGFSGAMSLKGKLPKGSKVGTFNIDNKLVAVNRRIEGFVSGAKSLGYKVVFNEVIGYGIHEAQAEAKKNLLKHPDVQAVFTNNETATFSTIGAIQELPKNKKPLLVGFDFRKEFIESLKNGDVYSLVVQDPYLIGYKSAEAIIKLEESKSLSKKIEIGTFILNKINIDQPEMKKRLIHYSY